VGLRAARALLAVALDDEAEVHCLLSSSSQRFLSAATCASSRTASRTE
jgi:hypothetical protein